MENTGSMLFKDDSPKWYIAQGQNWVGPMKSSEVFAKLEKGELTPAHYILQKGDKKWKRIVEVVEFQPTMPPPPPPEFAEEVSQSSIKKPNKPAPQVVEKSWYVYSGDSQLGPFSVEEVQRSLEVGSISSSSQVWKDGMIDWEPISDQVEFKSIKKAPPPKPSGPPTLAKKQDKRTSSRKPLIARIIMANKEKIVLGICRDISLGGMQVLTEQVPGGVGTSLKMNISPPQGLKAFVAEGEIVRVLEDGRGFSFRFKKLAPDAKKAIEKYISIS
ncbi:MAG: DUF4339 domain-containing protein [Xanthomonadaceae bacterium]|nr:DUF4339 domain-containing protein [Xanthomonadaceae bacterium]